MRKKIYINKISIGKLYIKTCVPNGICFVFLKNNFYYQCRRK